MGNGPADGAMNLYTAVAFVIVDIIALALRVISKRKTKKGLQCDDWWICAGLVLFFAWCGLIIYGEDIQALVRREPTNGICACRGGSFRRDSPIDLNEKPEDPLDFDFFLSPFFHGN